MGHLLAASIKAEYCSLVNSGSGKSRKNCLRRPATLLTSWKKFSGLRKSRLLEFESASMLESGTRYYKM